MISGIFVFNHKGDSVVARQYRDDIVAKTVQEAFKANVIHSRTELKSPITMIEKTNYLHLYRNGLWIVAITVENANACMIFEFINKLMDLCNAYFGLFTEINVKNNFSLIYELLDEVIDNGYPQSTDPETLKVITQMAAVKGTSLDELKQIASQVTGQIGWRRDGIKYKKNEIYLDVVEKVTCLISPSGQTLSSHVAGTVQMKCYLSGMPDCKFGINDKLVAGAKPVEGTKKKKKTASKDPIAIDDLTFHQCVRLGKFDSTRSISFVPPDGEFELMKYRITRDVQLPFVITPMIQEFSNVVDMTIVVKGDFAQKFMATKVMLNIPVSTSAATVECKTKNGKAKYKPGSNSVIWKMRTFNGGKTATCEVKVTLLKTAKASESKKKAKPPISIDFEVPFAPSGLQVKYLLVTERKLGYDDAKVMKWVRYLGSSGSYDARY